MTRQRAAAALFATLLFGCTTPSTVTVTPAPSATPVPAAAGPARVIVVGGGLAGLVSAYELQKRGVVSHVLEAGDTWGGRVATADYGGGLTAEFGMQELWAGNPLLGIAKELSVEVDGDSEPPWSSQVIDGKLYPYVQDSTEEYFRTLLASDAEVKQLTGWLARAEALRESAEKEGLKNPAVKKLQGISFKTWLESEHLPKNAEILIRRTIECELATDAHSFSALVGLMEFEVFLGEGQSNFHIKGGNSRLIDGLVRAVQGPKTLSAMVTRVERTVSAGGKTTVTVTYMKDHDVLSVQAERVVLAVPFWRLHQIQIVPPLSDDKWQAILTLNRGQYTVVHMLMPKTARKLWQVGGATPFAALSDGALGVIYGVQEPNEASSLDVFSLLVHGQAAGAWHMVPRETKLEEVRKEMDKLWPGFSKQIQATYVYTYHPASIPVWPPGRSPLDEQAALLRTPEQGLYLAGDYLYNAHSDGAARAGISAAERIAAELTPAR